ncbi:heterokaryon incompatibility protein [Glarea lozoyensis ATCC 20868]|uniref:Heterokaryon incompatibility protein n=1 Tax=Glarea lozoyensis (strain ATCC 20868 / MF5171) TaxID=1116229 RepID=S3D7F0_GLAL2|nr:heterokaryon incompatibility protein [Glarea lozoyensis ATCC 20868]EPE27936.1 heterokaryon incompatibility protein [Glarea lozoyensis ATCC 20868]
MSLQLLGSKSKKKFLFANISPSTSSFASLSLAYQWYISCRACHKQCNRLVKRPRWMPTRLLDIGVEGDANWKLHVQSQDGCISPNYVTLSYRWGSSPTPMLTQSTITEFRRGRPICDLPQTFKDAIVVARRFSIRYLWIDSLCIVQDSQEDWEMESSMMRDVYANSSCNIAATASVDPQGGLFRPRRQVDVQPGVIKLSTINSTEQPFLVYDKSYWDRHVSRSVLHRRGWVFQERLLAPRVLHFTKTQIFWECFRDQKCEGFPLGTFVDWPLKNFEALFEPRQRPLSLFAFSTWNDLVEAYSKCALTRPEDKLVALSGLARLFQDMTGDEYLAGLWRSRLPESLGWRVYTPTTKLSSDYRAPSWSWASVDGQVWPGGVGSVDTQLITVKEAQVTHSGFDSTGQVLDGFIIVEGLLVQTTYHRTGKRGPTCQLTTADEEISANVWKDALDTRFEDGSEMHCLALNGTPDYSGDSRCGYRLIGLILEPVAGPSGDYARIGHFDIDKIDDIEKFGISVDKEDFLVAQINPDQLSTVKII